MCFIPKSLYILSQWHKCASLKNEKWTFNKLFSQFKYFSYYDHLMRSTNITAAKSPRRYNWISNITAIKYKRKKCCEPESWISSSYMQLHWGRTSLSEMLFGFLLVIGFTLQNLIHKQKSLNLQSVEHHYLEPKYCLPLKANLNLSLREG